MGFPGGSDGKESACNAGDLGSIPGLGISPGEGHGNPLQYSCLEKTQGQRSLVGYSPWSHKESDMTELLSTAQHTRVCTYLYRPSQVGIVVKNPPASARDGRDKGSIPGSGRSPGVGNGNHSSIRAWEIPWIEEPGGVGLQSTGSQSQTGLSNLARASTHTHTHTHTHWNTK